MIQISGNNPILPKNRKYIKKPAPIPVEVFFSNFWPKEHRELLILNVSCKIFFFYFHQKVDNVFEVLKNVKILRFEDRGKLLAKIRFYR